MVESMGYFRNALILYKKSNVNNVLIQCEKSKVSLPHYSIHSKEKMEHLIFSATKNLTLLWILDE